MIREMIHYKISANRKRIRNIAETLSDSESEVLGILETEDDIGAVLISPDNNLVLLTTEDDTILLNEYELQDCVVLDR